MKQIIVEVNCVDEDATDLPALFTLDIDCTLRDRIKELSAAVKALDARYICESRGGGVWSDLELDDVMTGDVIGLIEAAENNLFGADFQQLRVTEAVFYFSANPEGCSDRFGLVTGRIPIEFLDNDEPWFLGLEGW